MGNHDVFKYHILYFYCKIVNMPQIIHEKKIEKSTTQFTYFPNAQLSVKTINRIVMLIKTISGITPKRRPK